MGCLEIPRRGGRRATELEENIKGTSQELCTISRQWGQPACPLEPHFLRKSGCPSLQPFGQGAQKKSLLGGSAAPTFTASLLPSTENQAIKKGSFLIPSSEKNHHHHHAISGPKLFNVSNSSVLFFFFFFLKILSFFFLLSPFISKGMTKITFFFFFLCLQSGLGRALIEMPL